VLLFSVLPARLPRLTRRAVLGAGSASALPVLAGSLRAYVHGFSLPSPSALRSLLPGFGDLSRSGAGYAAPVVRPLDGPLTYVAIGASDAVGWGVANRGRDGWVPVFQRQLPQPTRLLNLGVGGTLLQNAVDEQLPRAIAAQPDLVTIWLVVNDVIGGVRLDRYRDNLHRLLGELREKTDAVVAIGNVPYPPASLDPWGFPEFVKRTVTGRWNGVIAGAARAHGAVLVDLYRHWPLAQNPHFIGPDGLHPTAAGHHALAETFLTTLRTHGVV
jgi:lysophospholipase L1-like esterase